MNLDTSHTVAIESIAIQGAPLAWRIIDLGTPAAQPTLNRQQNVLPQLYELVQNRRIDDALDLLYDVIDDLLVSKSFAACERMLAKIDLARMNPDLLVGVLSITLPAKSVLTARDQFVRSVEEHLRQSLPPNETADLLRGLR